MCTEMWPFAQQRSSAKRLCHMLMLLNRFNMKIHMEISRENYNNLRVCLSRDIQVAHQFRPLQGDLSFLQQTLYTNNTVKMLNL